MSKNITQLRCSIGENGWPLIWMNTFHFCMENQLSQKQNKVNYGSFCSKKLGLNYMVLTKEFKPDILKKDCMTWPVLQSDRLHFKGIHSTSKNSGDTWLMQVKENIQWFHHHRQVLILTSQFQGLCKAMLILSWTLHASISKADKSELSSWEIHGEKENSREDGQIRIPTGLMCHPKTRQELVLG